MTAILLLLADLMLTAAVLGLVLFYSRSGVFTRPGERGEETDTENDDGGNDKRAAAFEKEWQEGIANILAYDLITARKAGKPDE